VAIAPVSPCGTSGDGRDGSAAGVAGNQARGYCHHVNTLGAGAGTPGGWESRDPPSQARPGQLAEEQSALRRVATLVARGEPPEAVFTAVGEEVGRLFRVDLANLLRYEPDRTETSVAAWGLARKHFPVGSRWPLTGYNLSTLVFEASAPVRVDRYADSSSGPLSAVIHEIGIRSAVGAPILVEGTLWGAILAGSTREQPLPADTEARLASFTELVATAIANTNSRAALGRLAEEQAALRRVATLVARATPPAKVFTAVAAEVGMLLAVDFAILVRYDPRDTLEVVGTWTRTGAPAPTPVGGRLPLGGRNVTTLVHRTGRPARIDYSDVSGVIGQVASRDWGLRSSIGVPVSAENRLWGCIVVAFGRQELLPADTEHRLAGFTELVATAIASTQARMELRGFAEEQAALRRLATAVARGAPPEEVFAAVAEEAGQVIPGAEFALVSRYDATHVARVAGGWARAGGRRLADLLPRLGERTVSTLVLERNAPARVDHLPGDDSGTAVGADEDGIRSSVGAPISVAGRPWGLMIVASTRAGALPAGAEHRLAGFTELVATAIANAEGQAALAASRARIVATADQTRRRIERDLHDGAQQQLVTLVLHLREAQAAARPTHGELSAQLARAVAEANGALEDLRETARGIHPAILAKGGLRTALRTLASRSPIPVDLRVAAEERLPEPVEVSAYYVAAEALTNVARHARAASVSVEVEYADEVLRVAVSDDGCGGADFSRGTGLVGLKDRVEAIGGRIFLDSPRGAGTSLRVELPITAANGDVTIPDLRLPAVSPTAGLDRR
jgi:signal transduction histidine kinase